MLSARLDRYYGRLGVPRGCISRIFTASMAFTVNNAARLSLNVYRRGRLRLRCGPLSCSHHVAFDAGLRPGPFPDQTASLLPGSLATTRSEEHTSELQSQ